MSSIMLIKLGTKRSGYELIGRTVHGYDTSHERMCVAVPWCITLFQPIPRKMRCLGSRALRCRSLLVHPPPSAERPYITFGGPMATYNHRQNAHTHNSAHRHTNTLTRIHTHTHSLSLSLTHTPTYTHTHSYTLTHTQTHTHSHAFTRTHSHAFTHTHAEYLTGERANCPTTKCGRNCRNASIKSGSRAFRASCR